MLLRVGVRLAAWFRSLPSSALCQIFCDQSVTNRAQDIGRRLLRTEGNASRASERGVVVCGMPFRRHDRRAVRWRSMDDECRVVTAADRERFLAARAGVRPDPEGVARMYERARETAGPVHAATLSAIERYVATRSAQPSF